MSDLQSILDDALYENYLEDQRYEKEMDIATLQQCIYLLVEGDTEEHSYPQLLKRCDIDLQDLGVVIGNYNGAGNLTHVLRLLKKTLSHTRPVIVTYDNDEAGCKARSQLDHCQLNKDFITLLPMPSVLTPIEYSNGHRGGSFEEMFQPEHFIDQVFSQDYMPEHLINTKGCSIIRKVTNSSSLEGP